MNKRITTIAVSVVIVTYGREQALIDSILSLLGLEQQPAQIVVVDQSVSHQKEVAVQLASWHQHKTIKLISLPEPSIPHAMNTGLVNADEDIVLFVDDDIKAHKHLVRIHYEAHQHSTPVIIAGKVIQPWDDDQKLNDGGHQFNSTEKKYISHFMGGNFSINKNLAINLGGFDENFIGVAYRFEKEFAQRWLEAGYQILFEPQAVIDHLKVSSGGTRKYGEHLTTLQPFHAVGAYYYIMINPRSGGKIKSIVCRLVQSIKTRHHLKQPWYIPLTLLAEIRGLIMARRLARAGPKFITVD